MSVAALTSQSEMSLLKEEAPKNMLDMSVTAEVSHELPWVLMSRSNEVAPKNM